MLGKRSKLVRIGSAAALAEASMAAAVEQAAARLADLERKAAFFDAAVVGDPLALGRAMAAPSGDPVREGMIARNLLDESAIRQQRFAESLEERAMLAAQHELELSAGSEPEVDLELLKLLGEYLAGEDLAGEDLAGEDLAGGDLAGPLPEQPEDVPEGPVFERGEVRGCSARASRRRRPSTTRPSCSTHSPRVLRRARGHQARDVGSFYSR